MLLRVQNVMTLHSILQVKLESAHAQRGTGRPQTKLAIYFPPLFRILLMINIKIIRYFLLS